MVRHHLLSQCLCTGGCEIDVKSSLLPIICLHLCLSRLSDLSLHPSWVGSEKYRETFCRRPNSPPLPRPPEASPRISPCRESAKKEKKGEEEKLRDRWRHQNGWIFGKVPNGLWPPPHFRKIILRISRQNCDKSAYVQYGGTVVYYMILFPMRCM